MVALHSWRLDPAQAIQLQESLRQRLVLIWDGRPVNSIAGVSVSHSNEMLRAAIVILRYPELIQLAAVTAEAPLLFPYIPGLLAFRLGPAILAAWEKLSAKPDVLFFEGHGIAHPRAFGLASHLGLWLETPSIGIARSRLYGNHQAVSEQPGSWSALLDEHNPDQVIGAVLRIREHSRPLYVSPGHLMDLPHALEFVLACSRAYHLPEPLHFAHRLGLEIEIPPLPAELKPK